jgi:hypothetical protein
VTGAILITGALVFCVFARGEVQPWANGDNEKPRRNLPTQIEEPLLLGEDDLAKNKNGENRAA